MTSTVVLDSGVLGLVTNPKGGTDARECALWVDGLLAHDTRVIIPAIADYEVRRELVRSNKTRGMARLDAYCDTLEYCDVTRASLRRAAHFWAEARAAGRPTAGSRELDGDMILVAQTMLLDSPGVIIATTNVRHLAEFVSAAHWQDIRVTDSGEKP